MSPSQTPGCSYYSVTRPQLIVSPAQRDHANAGVGRLRPVKAFFYSVSHKIAAFFHCFKGHFNKELNTMGLCWNFA